MTDALRFDPDAHRYFLDGRELPGVTRVLADLLPTWKATEWHLQRGRAVHACCALVAQGVGFEHDPRISGQVSACRRFFAEAKPTVYDVERPVFSSLYRYAGTLDMHCELGGRQVVLDYKATLTKTVPIQCAAYALTYGTTGPQWGVGVELHEDGTYRMSEMYPLKRYAQEWLALLGAYNVRQRLGIASREEEVA